MILLVPTAGRALARCQPQCVTSLERVVGRCLPAGDFLSSLNKALHRVCRKGNVCLAEVCSTSGLKLQACTTALEGDMLCIASASSSGICPAGGRHQSAQR